MARCIPGKERDALLAAARRIFNWSGSKKLTGVLSVFCRDGLPGYIYVEARSNSDAQAALEGIAGVQAWKLTLVPIDDMVDVVRVKSHAPKINPSSWVRVRRGNYAGDLAQVVSVLESSDSVEVRLIPRLDYDAETRGSRNGVRPPQRLFSVDEARRSDPRGLSSRQNEILWRNDRFINGYLHKDMRLTSLQVENVQPTLEEIAKFAAGEADDGDEQAAIAALASQAAAASTMDGVDEANGLSAKDLLPGEQVEVVEGDLAGVVGVVRGIEGDDTVKIAPELGGLMRNGRTSVMSFPARQLRKRFRAGDHVKVLNGRHRNETGMVVGVADAVVTMYADVAKQEIRVLAKDLRVSNEIGSGTGGGKQGAMVGLDVHDLVFLEGNTVGVVLKVDRDTLTILDERSETRTVGQQSVRPARGGFERTGVDFNGNPMRRGDVVRETNGARRQGTVLQITRFVTFVLARDQTSAGGVFTVRTRQLEAVNARKNTLDPYATRNNRAGNDRGRGRGGSRGGRVGNLRGGRDPLIGKNVTANRGPYKGYMGIVKDATDMMCRVELHTNARIVNIEKEKLVVKLPSGEAIPALEFNNGPMGIGGGNSGGSRGPSNNDSSGGGYRSGGASSSNNAGGWGAPPRSTYNDTRQTPVATPGSSSYGSWDTGATNNSGAGGGGGWDTASTPSGNAGWNTGSTPSGSGGWDAVASTPSGNSGWDAVPTPGAGKWNTSATPSGSWGTPAPATPGGIPQTPGGPFPQTPGAGTPAARSYYDAPTPAASGGTGADNDGGFFGWATAGAVVQVLGQRGTVVDVSSERQTASIKLETGVMQSIDQTTAARFNPRPSRPQKGDRVIVVRGAHKGAVGKMVGKDGNDGFFQQDGAENWSVEPQRNMVPYNRNY
ncbi:transcription elongation factor spt5 [Linderina macrospora]|uniref:Transcription elongation factor spt5 n=1 Tax=Linderina macrospora TaxID=4868 RepID=A0ACC1JAI4_9FUNG|nr:transcription elongation factor spt5 [Linderina macrospora]